MDFKSLQYSPIKTEMVMIFGPIEKLDQGMSLVFGAAMGSAILCGTPNICAMSDEEFTEEQHDWAMLLDEQIPARLARSLDMDYIADNVVVSTVVHVKTYRDGDHNVVSFHLEADGGPPTLYFIGEATKE